MSDQGPETRRSLLRGVRDLADGEAWREFLDIYGPVIRRYLHWRGVPVQDVEDLFQEVLAIVMRRMPTFEYDPRKGRFRGWLHTVTTNRVRRWFARRARQPRAPGGTVGLECLQALPDDSEELARRWESEFQGRVLELAIKKVQPRVHETTWQCFEMAMLRDIPPEEVAERLGVTIGQVYVNKSRVLRRVRGEVERYRDEQA